MTKNPVLDSTRGIVEDSENVRISQEKVIQIARDYAPLTFTIPDWRGPVFPNGTPEELFSFFMLANTINFAFTDFKTGEKYMTRFKDKEWKGAYGMYAALMQATESGVPIFDPRFLKDCTLDQVRSVFCKDTEIPMVEERARIWNEVGRVLSERYGGQFINLANESDWKLFNCGKGLVERLVADFPSFDDSCVVGGRKVCFNKRAQLFPGELHGRYLADHTGSFPEAEIKELTAFADYQLPKALRALGILQYSPTLAAKVDAQALIPAKSQDELEIRANTIHAFQWLLETINAIRSKTGLPDINVLHLDYKLWSEGRALPGKHHLTKTIAY
ncbi:hypothetical protein FJZ17_01120 [Candidatus Pacearchaeota archaeon]|nr:hypothetical protein [Candidatus Pacearchaeota archaeon]